MEWKRKRRPAANRPVGSEIRPSLHSLSVSQSPKKIIRGGDVPIPAIPQYRFSE
jgi:hypothetical protein